MTESEWIAGEDPVALLAHLNRRTGDRKLLLYLVACCRTHWHLLVEMASRDGVEWVERFADGLAARDEEYERLEHRSEGAFFKFDQERSLRPERRDELAPAARAAFFANIAMCFSLCDPHHPLFRRHMEFLSIPLVHDIFGNPFRPVAFAPAWRTSAALALARQMYDARDFAAMPILADALGDAGCDHPELLAHCRGGGPHVRGCWAVDLVLDKS